MVYVGVGDVVRITSDDPIVDVPQAILSLGFSLNGSNIKEGDDVYFECNVRSHPRPYKISWRRNVSDSPVSSLHVSPLLALNCVIRLLHLNNLTLLHFLTDTR